MRQFPILQWLLSLAAFLILLLLGSFLFWVWRYPDAIGGQLVLVDHRRVVTAGQDVRLALSTNGGYAGDPILRVDGTPVSTPFASTRWPWRVTTTWHAPTVKQPYTLTARFETLAGATVATEPLPVDVVPPGSIAFARSEDDGGAPAVYVMATDGSQTHRWARDARSPTWGPDGTLYFVRAGAIWRQTAAEEPAERLRGTQIGVATFAWGSEIALVDHEGHLIVRGENGTLNTFPVRLGPVLDVAWSPTGEELVLTIEHGDERNVDLFVYSLASQTVTQRLTFDRAKDWQPAWHPKRDELLFTSNRSGTPQIYWVELPLRGEPSVVTRAPGGAWQASWQPAGDWFACSLQRGGSSDRREIVLQRRRDPYAVLVTDTPTEARHPVWRTVIQ